jgi:drug/metabolite transporter (DMT)-like permease
VVGGGRDQRGYGAGFLILQLGSAGWSLGSILQRRQVSNTHPVVSGAIQQLATGIVALIPASFTIRNAELSTRGSLAVLYLVMFGSIVGYSAYIYAMSELPVAVVSIYTYINPIVAVWLGWLFYREPFGSRGRGDGCHLPGSRDGEAIQPSRRSGTAASGEARSGT